MHVAAIVAQSVRVSTAFGVHVRMAHLHWGSHNHGFDVVPEPWSKMKDMVRCSELGARLSC